MSEQIAKYIYHLLDRPDFWEICLFVIPLIMVAGYEEEIKRDLLRRIEEGK